MADSQNEYFISKVNKIKEELDPPVADPLDILRSLMAGRTCGVGLSPIHPSEVLEIISNLSNSKAFGLDALILT